MQSAIEKELANKLYELRHATANHDRGVVWGMVLSCIPVPPISILAIIISLINLNLIKDGKLKVEERGMIIKSLSIAVAMLALGSFFIYMMYSMWMGLNLTSLIDVMRTTVSGIIEVFKNLIPSSQKTISV